MYDRFPDPERQLHEATAQEYIRNYQLQQQLAELGFDLDDDDYPSAIDEEAGAVMELPSFDISDPNYDPHANDGERQFQLIGTPRSVGSERNKGANRRADFISGREAASRLVPIASPVSSSIVPRTALLGRAAWGSQTRSTDPRQGSAARTLLTLELSPQKLDPRFEDLFGVD